MGRAAVGAMVVMHRQKWEKESYRHYNLDSRDEYGQMREMLGRRVDSFDTDPPPDLWVIDGGETLRRVAVDLLKEAGGSRPGESGPRK